jgi:hypothetical protein
LSETNRLYQEAKPKETKMAAGDVKQRSSKRKRLTDREVLNAWANATYELRSGPIGWDPNRRGGNVFERFARLGLTPVELNHKFTECLLEALEYSDTIDQVLDEMEEWLTTEGEDKPATAAIAGLVGAVD